MMNDKDMKIINTDPQDIEKIPGRKTYSTPRLVCYGNLNELTRNGGNDPPWGDLVPAASGYVHTD